MTVNENFEHMGKWTSDCGLYPVRDPIFTCDDITNITASELENMELEEIEELMIKISSYLCYIQSIKSSIEAQLKILENPINRKISKGILSLDDRYKYCDREEKKTIVINSDLKLKSEINKLDLLKAKFARIQNMPFPISKKLDIIRAKYNRKYKEYFMEG